MGSRQTDITGKMREGRVYISGTGRAGTTLLVELLTAAGCDTGFSPTGTSSSNIYFKTARAGLELDLFDKDGPQICKSPYLCDQVDLVLKAGIVISHVIIPVREFASSALSRAFVQEQTPKSKNPVAGGFWDAGNVVDQELILRSKFANLVEACVRNDIPMTFLSFPRFARDADYLFRKLEFLLRDKLVFRNFQAVFDATVRSEFIHDFSHNACNRGAMSKGKPIEGDH